MKYRIKTGSRGRFENGANRVYRKGDEIELSAAEVAALSGRRGGPQYEPIGTAAETEPAAEPPTKRQAAATERARVKADDDEAEQADELAATHWNVVVKGIGEIDDPAAVSALLEAEKAGKARKSVIEAAEERLAELGA